MQIGKHFYFRISQSFLKFSSRDLYSTGFSFETQKSIDKDCSPKLEVKSSLFKRYNSRSIRLIRFRSTAFLKYLLETETPTFWLDVVKSSAGFFSRSIEMIRRSPHVNHFPFPKRKSISFFCLSFSRAGYF